MNRVYDFVVSSLPTAPFQKFMEPAINQFSDRLAVDRAADRAAALSLINKFYEEARKNVVARLGLRDNCILLSLAGFATLMAAAHRPGGPGQPPSHPIFELMAVAPIVAGLVMKFVTQHNHVMDTLYEYIAEELAPHFRILGAAAPCWEMSDRYEETRGVDSNQRFKAEAWIILGPSLYPILACMAECYDRVYHGKPSTFLILLTIAATIALMFGLSQFQQATRNSATHLKRIMQARRRCVPRQWE